MQINRLAYSGLIAAVVLLGACSSEEPVSTSGTLVPPKVESGISLETLSTKSWLISGGDVLVEVSVENEADVDSLSLSLNGNDVSDQFIAVSSHAKQAVLGNLPVGESTLAVSIGSDSRRSETLALSNYPISGPIISGPHETPFRCQSSEFELVSGGRLGAETDEDCNVVTRVDYVYWSSEEEVFKPFRQLLNGGLFADTAYLTSPSGESVPYILRVETGTVNRAIYEIAMLHNPADGRIDPWNRSKNWNGKLVYTHGGGCRTGWHQQGNRTGGVVRPGLFEQGYAIVSSTLNVFGQNCNDLLASETHIMVKERFVEHYGVPDYTIATGASGGSYQSHQTADNYPGVFDGIIVGLSFPDVTTATIFTVADARLLNYYFAEVNAEGFTEDQQQAIAGFGALASIPNLSRGAARLDPVFYFETPPEEQGGEVSVSRHETMRYHVTIPNGIRATVYDHTVNVYGRVGDSSSAQRPLDNVGVQYGLAALNDEIITAQQFIDLNQGIGGFDRDMNHISDRHRADEYASKRAIESGRILYGGAGLAHTPIIDYRSYTDHAENGDIHMIFHQFSTRQRLLNANGHADNQVMQVGGKWGFTEESPDMANLFRQMDSWITAIQRDDAELDAASKVVANKPATLNDACWDNSGAEREKIEETQNYKGSNRCSELYPAYSSPRQIAGAPLANDIVSCQLKAIDASDYAVSFNREQASALEEIFSSGVCDWSRGEASTARHQGTWSSIGPSPVNLLQ